MKREKHLFIGPKLRDSYKKRVLNDKKNQIVAGY